ncbi:MAG: hypothetical protein IPJ65_16420 [Archangiaceae bacterium]|nr:hypothetical protein [Archangiaceae bacterium]
MRRFSTLTFVVAVWVFSCSGSSGGCTALGPIPGTAGYTGPKTDNAVNLQISPEGINYVNANYQSLLNLFAPGGTLNLQLDCMTRPFNIPVLGSVTAYIADQGDSAGNGRNNGSCTGDQPANIAVKVEKLAITPVQTDQLSVAITARIKTERIYIKAGCAECGLDFDTDRDPGPQNGSCTTNPNNCVGVNASIKFTIDTKWDKLLSFSVTALDGTKICGSSGAMAQPRCISGSDVDLTSECGCNILSCPGCVTCSAVCSAADWDPIKNFILEQISPLLQDQIQSALAGQSCRTCGAGLPACPTAPGGGTSSCKTGQCIDNATQKCVPRFLGVEGRVNLGAAAGSFGVPSNALLDLGIQAGSSFKVDTANAVNVGTRGGLMAVKTAACVPPATAPTLTSMPAPDLRADAPPGTYHMAIGLNSQFLNLAFHQAQQAGVLCLQLSSATVGLINTGLFKTFLPSLGKLATRDGKDAPMMVVLRPAKPPEVKVGSGGPKPLLTVTLTDLTIDFYASIDDRFARLFSITADITLPLSLTFSGCTQVTPAIGDVKSLVSNIRTANAEMLAEDPQVLADLIPAIVGFAEPALASALKPIDLPDLGPFKLKVNAAKGVGNVAGTENYNHLGLYATLLPVGAACATLAPRLTASLFQSIIPTAEQMRLKGQKLPWPVAVLSVKAEGVEGTPEFSTRVDEGLWTEFHPANAAGQLEVSHPMFLLQGTHQISVRARVAEDPHGVGEPAVVPFKVDWDAPEVSLSVDRAHDRLTLHARDVISADDRLEYSYRVGSGEFGSYGAARDIVLSAIEQQGGVSVRVRDEVGNVGEAQWRVPQVADHPSTDPAQGQPPGASPLEPEGGCAAGAGLPLLGALLLVARRLRPRA